MFLGGAACACQLLCGAAMMLSLVGVRNHPAWPLAAVIWAGVWGLCARLGSSWMTFLAWIRIRVV